MARRARDDAAGQWHHVTNRGIAKRTMFETERDFRQFLSLLAKEVRAKRLEVHAFCLMLNHYHLLVKSVDGRLSESMANIQREYSRWFNRTRKRDGSLVKGRFKSRVIRDMAHRCNTLTYIHDNPVVAKEAAQARDFRGSSAAYWAGRSERKLPRWLATSWVQRELDERGATHLEEIFPSRIDDDFRAMIEKELGIRRRQDREDTTIRHALGARTVRWAYRKAKLADGTRPFRRISPARLVEQAISLWIKQVGPLVGLFRRTQRDAWTTMRAGLL